MEWFNSFQIQCVKWGTDLFCITGNRSAGHFQTNVPFVSPSIILVLRGKQRSQSERRIKRHLFLMFHLQTKRHPLICGFWSVTLTTTWQELSFRRQQQQQQQQKSTWTVKLVRLESQPNRLLMNLQKKKKDEIKRHHIRMVTRLHQNRPATKRIL